LNAGRRPSKWVLFCYLSAGNRVSKAPICVNPAGGLPRLFIF